MKMIAVIFVIMLMTSCGASVPNKFMFREEAQKMEAKTSGTSIDNHHAIPRDQYDNWSSPGNMPGGSGDGGKASKP
ncbi:hypothetical protein LUZ62_051909 [Rhynchospora pubera]|uniref:Lipoprotein n=1 Tax=Rhynchospora pubera TaxID=906938 RepID=A0AAV8GC56_9POAL|nr:hypothetical protein LUZ62_051909 [Rhynchospora pubera]